MINTSADNRTSKTWFSPLIWGIVLTIVSLDAGSLLAQPGGPGMGPGMGPGRTGPRRGKDRQDQEVSAAITSVKNIADLLLVEHISECMPLSKDDIEAIQEELKLTEPFQGRFGKEDKAYVYLIEAFLAHFSGDSLEALAKARKASEAYPDNLDMSDAVIMLALYHEQYDTAQEILKEREGGIEVREEEPQVEKVDPGKKYVDPNGVLVTGVRKVKKKPKVEDPNTALKETPPKKRSKWSQRQVSGRKKRGGGLGLGVGPQMGPITPVDPMALEQRGPRSRGRSKKSKGRDRKKTSAKKGLARRGKPSRGPRQTYLNLPVEFMPYEWLGKDFSTVNLRNVNGSYFSFQPGQGQILCALLWQIPSEKAPKRRGSRSRHRPMPGMGPGMMGPGMGPGMMGPGMGPGMMGPGMGPGMMGPGMAPRPRKKGKSTITPVEYDLWANAEQFGDLFRKHLPGRKMNFMAVNLDKPRPDLWDEIAGVLFDTPWPWVNCIASEPHNQSQWTLKERYSQAMVLVDTKGKIRYVGPVGGFLPEMLLKLELSRATSATSAAPTAVPSTRSSAGAVKGILGGLFGADSAKKTATIESAPADPNGLSQADTRERETIRQSPPRHIEQKPSNPQAKNMLQTAHIQKRLTPRSALETCDEILERYSDSLEADEAKLLIKSILRSPRNRMLKQEREKQGKYIGE